MDRDRGIRGERPRRVPGGVPRDRARGDRLRPVLLPVARGALVLAWRRSHRPDCRGASVCVRTRGPRRGIRRGPSCPPRFPEGPDDRIRIPRGVPRRLGGGRGPGRPRSPLRVAVHGRGRGAAAACRPGHGVHRHLFDVSAHRCGAPRSEGLAVHLVVAPRSGARNRINPGAILRERSGSPPRVVQSSPRSSAGGTHHGSRACPPGFPHPRDHRTLRRRRRDRGSWTPDTTRSRRERLALVRGPGCRGSGPRQMALPNRVRGAPRPARHRHRVLEGQGDGGALHGRGTHRGGRKMKRVSTHIEGLDEVLGGGIPEGNVVLVSGAPGTMKTSLTYHILHSSALNGSRGLYVSLEQGRASLIDHTEGLGYRLDDTNGNLSVLDLGTLRKKLKGSADQPWLDLFKLYTQGIRKSFDYRFLVLDSLDALEILAKFGEPRREVFFLLRWPPGLMFTAVPLGELPTDRTAGADPRRAAYAKHKEDYLVDGILHLRLARQGEFGMQRQLRVVKMRGTRHDTGYHALVFDNGFRVTRGFA